MSGNAIGHWETNGNKHPALENAKSQMDSKISERTSYEELKASVEKLTNTLGECSGNLDCCHTNAMEAVVDTDIQAKFAKIGEYKTTIDNQKATLEGVSTSATTQISILDSEIAQLDSQIASLSELDEQVWVSDGYDL